MIPTLPLVLILLGIIGAAGWTILVFIYFWRKWTGGCKECHRFSPHNPYLTELDGYGWCRGKHLAVPLDWRCKDFYRSKKDD
jgi:hypothetical protein